MNMSDVLKHALQTMFAIYTPARKHLPCKDRILDIVQPKKFLVVAKATDSRLCIHLFVCAERARETCQHSRDTRLR